MGARRDRQRQGQTDADNSCSEQGQNEKGRDGMAQGSEKPVGQGQALDLDWYEQREAARVKPPAVRTLTLNGISGPILQTVLTGDEDFVWESTEGPVHGVVGLELKTLPKED